MPRDVPDDLAGRVVTLLGSPDVPGEVGDRLRRLLHDLPARRDRAWREEVQHLRTVASVPWLRAPQGWREHRDLSAAVDRELHRHRGARHAGQVFVEHAALRAFRNRPAVRSGSGGRLGTAMLLVGPPGVGKTRLAGELARAAGTGFSTIGLAGQSDGTALRGFPRTYARSQPSVVTTALVRAGRRDAVILLDEVDKLGPGGSEGRPADALLEVLDGRGEFRDDHLDLPLPLSEVCWIATANDLGAVPAPLLDRVEVVHVTGFARLERELLVVERLWPQVLQDVGLWPVDGVRPETRLVLRPSAARLLAAGSGTRDEEGLRTTERRLHRLLAVLAARIPHALELLVRRPEVPALEIDEGAVADLLPELRAHRDPGEVGGPGPMRFGYL
ncbi:AAA family ATPase [Kineococcus aurantiacus]|uniref:ATP-dependent Lon protease n=1 Tax=Kineococcus aurantiacus TaxID=37633 RepID=A0A7Y9ATU0_9ACTN|nr:ATP-dependent Lon protease [Kineococcus aurantiacus]